MKAQRGIKVADRRLSRAKVSDGFVKVGAIVHSTSPEYRLAGRVDDIRWERTGGTRVWVSWAGMLPVPMSGQELRLR